MPKEKKGKSACTTVVPYEVSPFPLNAYVGAESDTTSTATACREVSSSLRQYYLSFRSMQDPAGQVVGTDTVALEYSLDGLRAGILEDILGNQWDEYELMTLVGGMDGRTVRAVHEAPVWHMAFSLAMEVFLEAAERGARLVTLAVTSEELFYEIKLMRLDNAPLHRMDNQD